jgi:hypothetical protein
MGGHVALQDRKPPVVNPSIPADLAHRRATDREQAEWTPQQRAANTCMHCGTAYKTGSGGAWICEHRHEGYQ